MTDYYIQGLGEIEYTIGGVRIPKGRYTEKERAKGRRTVVGVSSERYAVLNASPLFCKLLREGSVRVSARELREERGAAEQPRYDGEKERLIEQAAALGAELNTLRAAFTAQGEEVERLKAELADAWERKAVRRGRASEARSGEDAAES